MGRFKPYQKGAGPTLVEAAEANKVFEVLNALEDLTVTPQGGGKLTFGKKNAVLDLSGLLPALLKLQAAQAAIDGTTSSGLPPNSKAQSDLLASVVFKLDALIACINGVSIACDPMTAQITITFPNVPTPITPI